MGNKFVLSCLLTFLVNTAQAGNCEYMADMAKDAASLRDDGVPLAAVEARLKKDVSDPEELTLGLIVVRIVYKTRGTAQQLKNEILKNCKKTANNY